MNPDDELCLCFHVSMRKVVNYCRRERPPVASLISECLSAGTGCGWCVPFLKRIHADVMAGTADPTVPFSPEEYAASRSSYRKQLQNPTPSDPEPQELGNTGTN